MNACSSYVSKKLGLIKFLLRLKLSALPPERGTICFVLLSLASHSIARTGYSRSNDVFLAILKFVICQLRGLYMYDFILYRVRYSFSSTVKRKKVPLMLLSDGLLRARADMIQAGAWAP